MKIAVIYTRVSSRTQVKKGDGLASQERRCREFAAYKDYKVVEVFKDEGVSGGLADRPGMKDMLVWLRKHRASEPVVLIDDVSRLARDTDVHRKLRNAFGSVGATLESPSIEFGDDADSVLFENIVASMAQHYRQKNGEQVVNRMKARLMNGYFAFWVPTGYRYERVKGHSGKMMVRDEPDASLIQEALEGFATGRFQTQSEVKRFLEPHPIFARDHKGEIHPQRIKNLLTNKIYAGYYEYKPWGVPLTKGKHEPIISWEIFQRIQDRLNENAYAPRRNDATDEFPLRGFVTCGCCGHPLTAYWANALAETAANGQSTDFPSEDEFLAAYGPERGSTAYGAFIAGHTVAKASHALTKAPLDQHVGIVEGLKPEPGDALYADRMTGYEQARTLAARLRASAMDDSAAYILTGSEDARAG